MIVTTTAGSGKGVTKDTAGMPGKTTTSNSGGYFAIAVALQDVSAKLVNGARLTARQDVRVNSAANAEVTTEAVSALPADQSANVDQEQKNANGDTPGTLDYVRNISALLLKKAADAAGEKNETIAKLTAGLGVTENKYAVRSSGGNDAEKGAVAFSAQRAEKGGEVTVYVAPKEGYTVDTVRLRYLVPGASEYTYATLTQPTRRCA